MTDNRCAEMARVALGGIRIVNGALALVAPKMLMSRLGVDPAAHPAVAYGMRMFGIRTLLIGLDLLSTDRDVRERAVKLAPVIHGSDTVCAAIALLSGDLPKKGGLMATAISGVNVALAIAARSGGRPATAT